MKKTISVLLSLIMILSVLGVCGFEAFASYPVMTLDEEVTVNITTGGQIANYLFTPEETGDYIIKSYGTDEDVDGALYRGSSRLTFDYDGGEGMNFLIRWHLEAGTTYEIQAKFYSKSVTGSFKLIVERNPLVSFEYIPSAELTVEAGTSMYPDLAGDTVIMHFIDGTQKSYKVGVGFNTLYAEDGTRYMSEYGYINIKTSLDYDSVWKYGATDAELYYYIGDLSCTLPIKVVKDAATGVKSLSVTTPKRFELIENVSGNPTYTDGELTYFDYSWHQLPVGTKVTVTFNDGKQKVFTFNSYGDFKSEDGDDFYEHGSYRKDENAVWSKDSDNYLTFTYGTATAKLPVYIIDNPISSFTYDFESPFTENQNGYFNIDSNGTEYYYYYYADYTDGVVLTLNYKNSDSKQYFYITDPNSGTLMCVDADLNPIPYNLPTSFYDNQETEHWTVGTDNKLTVYIGTMQADSYVEIIPNTVASIELTLANDVCNNPDDLNSLVYQSGNKVTVHYTDATTKVYTMKWDEENYGFYYFDTDGNRIDGRYFYTIDSQDETGRYVEANYMGISAKVYPTILDLSVTKISFVPAAPIVIEENTFGTALKDGTYYYYSEGYWKQLLADGGKLYVEFSDGSSKEYTSYCNGVNYWLVDADGAAIDYNRFNYRPSVEQICKPWTVGGDNSITVEYAGAAATVPVTITSQYKGFPDVPANAWFYDAVKYCAVRGFITGYQNGKFGPADNLKRQDFVVILARIAGADLKPYENVTSKMPDVKKGSYYAAAVNWAVDNKIINGYNNGKFGVGDNITREQVATILYRYMGSPAVTGADATLKPFADAGKISSFAKDAVVWAIQNGVISGKNATTLAPTATASRAEIATIVMRMDQNGMFNA